MVTHARPRTHGRRLGRPLSPRKKLLLSDVLPRLAVPLSSGIDPAALFGRSGAELHLEIGFGGGEHLLARARAAPETDFLGCEPFINGAVKLISATETENLANIRIHGGDAMEVITRLPEASISRAYILYPDPWPKLRHHKRRFVSDESLAALARVTAPGGELRIATDIDEYAAWILQRALRSPDFVWTAERSADWTKAWPDWTSTRYEQKAFREGRQASYLMFRRR